MVGDALMRVAVPALFLSFLFPALGCSGDDSSGSGGATSSGGAAASSGAAGSTSGGAAGSGGMAGVGGVAGTSTGGFAGQGGSTNALGSAVSVGLHHSCAILTSGAAKCWGLNLYGQVGNGKTHQAPVPDSVSGLEAGVAAISAGSSHTCALLTSGAVKCWGQNNHGQLGDGSKTQSPVPVDVKALVTGVTAISSGDHHACAVLTSGALKCWGQNGQGQLGNGKKIDSLTPVDVTGLTADIAAVSAGSAHTCALVKSGGVKCWGNNFYGQLGNGSKTDSPVPVNVGGLTANVASISVGSNHACAVSASGGLECWGNSDRGQLGNGSKTGFAPVAVSGLTSNVAAAAAGLDNTCAILTSGAAKCWGRNDHGQLGNGSKADSLVPADVSGLTANVAAMSSGLHSCAVLTTGALKCWGANKDAQLGNGSHADSSVPVDVKL